MFKNLIIIICFVLNTNVSIANEQDSQSLKDNFDYNDTSKAIDLIEHSKGKLIENKIWLTAEDNYWLGELNFKNNNIEESIKYYKKAIEKDDHFIRAYIKLADIYINHKKDLDKAEEVLNNTMYLSEISMNGQYAIAKLFLTLFIEKEEYGNAEKISNNLLSSNPDNLEFLYPLLNIYASQNKVNELLKLANKVYELDKLNTMSLTIIMVSLQKSNLYKEAQEYVNYMYQIWQTKHDSIFLGKNYFVRDFFKYKGINYVVYENFEMKGNNAIKYTFMANGKDRRYIMGSYDFTTQVAWKTGSLPKDQRIYHFDLYETSEDYNSHYTIEMLHRKEPPSYEEAKKIILKYIQDGVGISSSSTQKKSQ